MGGAVSREDRGPVSSTTPTSQIPLRLQHLSLRSHLSGGASSSSSSRSRTWCEETPTTAPPPLPPPLLESDISKDTTAAVAAPPPPPPASSSPSSPQEDSISAAAQQVSAFPNPGPFEQATMDTKRLVTLDTFDGFRCDINKQVSPFMAAVHSFWLGTSMIPDGSGSRKSTYTFLTQVADEKGLLMARVDPYKWSVDGRIHRSLLGGLALGKVQLSVSPSSSSDGGSSSQGGGGGGGNDQILAEIDFGGLTWTGNLKYGSMGGGIVYGCNYFQSITPKLAMGGEGMYIGANHNLLGNYLIKYIIPAKTGDEGLVISTPSSSASTTASASSPITGSSDTADASAGGSSTFCFGYNAGQAAATISYRRVVTPNRVQLASELQFSPFTLDSRLLIGAEFKLARSKMAVCLDAGDGRIQTLLEAKLGIAPGSPTLNFSADVNHWEDDMRFGYGINIEG